jgi:hypothetical protein
MSQIVDNLVAYKILTMLVKPFKETQAFKLGIIDDKGTNLKKSGSLRTSEEKDSYTYLHRLVFNMKKIINKIPGGESNLKSLVAALFLVREYYDNKDRTTSLMESKYLSVLEKINAGVTLAEEEIAVKKFVKSMEEDAPVNNVGGGAIAQLDQPLIDKKKIKKYKTVVRRSKPVGV